MTDLLRRCPACGEYTLAAQCPRDGSPTKSPRPAKYSPEDPYGGYRRRLKLLDRDGPRRGPGGEA